MLHVTQRCARLVCTGTTVLLKGAGHRRPRVSKDIAIETDNERNTNDNGLPPARGRRRVRSPSSKCQATYNAMTTTDRLHVSEKRSSARPVMAGLGLATGLLAQVSRQGTAQLLRPTLEQVEQAQRRFFFGHIDSKSKNDAKEHQSSSSSCSVKAQSVFDWIEARYGRAMAMAQDAEVIEYNALQRVNYGERIAAEVAACRRTRRAYYEAKARELAAQYRRQLRNDRASFVARRQRECEAGLLADCEQYVAAMKAFRVSHAKVMRAVQHNTSPLEEHNEHNNESVNVSDTHENALSDQANNATADTQASHKTDEATSQTLNNTSANDLPLLGLPDLSETHYATQRYTHYEQLLQREVDAFVHNRKAFYEELFHAQVVQHGSKLREELKAYEASRAVVYEDKLRQETAEFARELDEHYVQCFLQCYARLAWQSTRRAAIDKSTTTTMMTHDGKDASEQASSIHAIESATPIGNEKSDALWSAGSACGLRLNEVLEVYKAETLAESSRDAFLRAARRVACDEMNGLLPMKAPKEEVKRSEITVS